MAADFREINLELGKPTVDEALRKLRFEIDHSRQLGCTAVKLIHGYGSHGVGGKIRTASRRCLLQMKTGGAIRDMIPGEEFSIFNEATLQAFRCCDALRQDEDRERYNNGITIVIL